jgi:predicted ATPase/DNA-binding CsgD family transcriptional regulator
MVSARALPVSASTIVGRGAEVEAVSAALVTERLVTLTGPPGVGKTRLALAVAESLRERFDVVAWVDLAPVRDPDLVAAEIAHAAGVRRVGALADGEVLVVLDNCEHLLAAAPTLADLLATMPGLRVLATSRERWRLRVERELAVPPLPMPSADDQADLRRLAANPAVALVLDRAPAYLELDSRTAPALVDICVRLDGLPLALEFAAARLRVFTPGELAFRLGHRVQDLAGAVRDAPDRHRDLRAAITWSHDLLPEPERAVFRRLSVFEGGWTLDAAQEVCAGPDEIDVLAAVESLLDKSLVRRVDGQPGPHARFSMLASLREYAAERLELSGEGDPTRGRHAAWFAEVAQAWESTVGTADENQTWDQFGLVRADLDTALAQVQGQDPEATLWLQVALSWFWYTHGSPSHAAGLTPDDADLARAGADARDAAGLVTGVVTLALGDPSGAEPHLRAAYSLSEAAGDRRRAAVATAFLGHVARERGAYDEATSLYRRARQIYEELGNARGVGWAACDLGLLVADRGELDAAEELLREAMLLFESMNYQWAVAVSSCGLAGVRIGAGDPDAAAELAARALALHTEVGDVRGVAQSLEVLAEVALARGAAATAARLLGAAAVRRDRVAARPTTTENERVSRASASVALQLGATEAQREQRAGGALTTAAVRALVDRLTDSGATGAAVALTGRQLEVAALVAAGRTNRQIARELGISEKTAELHVRNAMQRLGAQNRAGVAAWVAGQPS